MSKQCWVIKDPKGKLLIWGISKKRSECLDFYCGYHFDRKVWRQLYREGCRCVKVEIAELKEAKRDSKRLEDLELALKEGDVCEVTTSDMVEPGKYTDEPGKYKYIEIAFYSDREPVTRESLADAIDEAIEEPEYE